MALADGFGLGLRRRGHSFHQRHIIFHYGVHLGDMQQGFPEDPGHLGIDLDDQPVAMPGRGGDEIVDGAEGEEAGLIHGRHGGDHHVDIHEFPAVPGQAVELVGHEGIETDSLQVPG